MAKVKRLLNEIPGRSVRLGVCIVSVSLLMSGAAIAALLALAVR